jgi:glycerol-3-phosphate cytidylyltransferase-like family protein
MKPVTDVFVEDSLELKAKYLRDHNADVLVMGNDWEGKFDHLRDICQVVYLPRTEGISTTDTIHKIKRYE